MINAAKTAASAVTFQLPLQFPSASQEIDNRPDQDAPSR